MRKMLAAGSLLLAALIASLMLIVGQRPAAVVPPAEEVAVAQKGDRLPTVVSVVRVAKPEPPEPSPALAPPLVPWHPPPARGEEPPRRPVYRNVCEATGGRKVVTGRRWHCVYERR